MMTTRKKMITMMLGSILLSGCTMKSEEMARTPKGPDELTFYENLNSNATNKPAEKPAANKTSVPPPPINNVTNAKMYTTPPTLTLDTKKKYTATLKTEKGDIVIALAASETPITVNNFVFLAREKFYDGTVFHRTIKNFMIQGGDPQGTGAGGPGYRFNDEPFAGEYTRGTVAMANAGPNTNGSQFFIMHADNPLPPNYVIFGKVVSGMEVVDMIATAPTRPDGEGSSPVTPTAVRSVDIVEQ